MANMNVKKRLESIERELNAVGKYIHMYHGVPREDAMKVDNLASDIVQTAGKIAAMAREAQGDRTADRLVKALRKALGFTYP